LSRPGPDDRAAKNARTALVASGVVAAMTLFVFFGAAPLYDTFCRVTGFDGTTSRADKTADVVLDRKITVRFDGTVSGNLPWRFKPDQVSQTLKVGSRASPPSRRRTSRAGR